MHNQMQKKAQEFAQNGTVVMLELCQHAQVLMQKDYECLFVCFIISCVELNIRCCQCVNLYMNEI